MPRARAREILKRTRFFAAGTATMPVFGADKAKVVNDALGARLREGRKDEFGKGAQHSLKGCGGRSGVVDFPCSTYDDGAQTL